MFDVQLLCDSATPGGRRLLTWQLTYPRFIHAEFMTHRCFSRNAASSRAIPIAKMQKAVLEEPAEPAFWGANQAGMSAAQELEGDAKTAAELLWHSLARKAVQMSQQLAADGLHKQLANRPLEWCGHITVIATSSEPGLLNFFGLRTAPDAQPEFQVLALLMLKAYLASKPRSLLWGEWHIPFDPFTAPAEGTALFDMADRLRIATGRIARISYLTHEGKRDPQADIALHDKLQESGHWSPFEHCARACSGMEGYNTSNFGPGWLQYRKMFDREIQKPTNEELRKRLENAPLWAKKHLRYAHHTEN